MASTDSTIKLSSVLASLSETLGEFRTENAEIESSFFKLVEGITELGPCAAAADATSDETAASESVAIEHLENLDRSIAEQREEFAGKQDELSDDVGQLRELVDRQIQLFAAWIKSTTKLKNGNSSRKGNRSTSSEDEVINDVFAQFEELRGATAAVSELSTS